MTQVRQPLEKCEEREGRAKRFDLDYSLLVKKNPMEVKGCLP